MTKECFKKFIVAGIILPTTAGIYAISSYKDNSISPYLNTKTSKSNIYSSANFSDHTSLTPADIGTNIDPSVLLLRDAQLKLNAKLAAEKIARLQNHRAVDISQQQQGGYDQQQQGGYNQQQQGGYNQQQQGGYNQQQQGGYNQQQQGGYNQQQQGGYYNGGYYDGGYYNGGYYDGGYYNGWYQYQSELLDKQNAENFDPR